MLLYHLLYTLHVLFCDVYIYVYYFLILLCPYCMSFYQGTPNSQTKETHKIESRLCEQEAATLTHIDVQICWVKQRNCIYVVRGRCWSRSSAKKNMLSTLGSTGVFPTNKCPAPKNNRHNLSLFKNILCLYAHLLFHFLASFRTTRVFFRTWTAPVLEETSWSTQFVPSWADCMILHRSMRACNCK